MAYTIRNVEVWAGDIFNRPGMLARVLESLASAGAQLEFIVSRRVTENTGRVFLAPIKGVKQQRAAVDVGLVHAKGMHSIRIEGPDRAGLGSEITRAIAGAQINVRGLSAATIGRKSVIYIALGNADDTRQATKVVRRLLASPARR